jgi:predicted nucleotidyltransferase
MNNFSLDISEKIDPEKAEVLAAVTRAAGKNSIPFFIVGGAARDFILENGYGVRAGRVTLDVDIGIRVASWDEYSKIIETLLSDEQFTETEIEHRYESPSSQSIKVDLLPFGGIETEARTIRWRRDNNEMSMAGFDEAYKSAILVVIKQSPQVQIKMTSLAGLALLKIISWNDNPDERDRDAKDFREIMYNYLESYPAGSLYSVHPDITGEDYELTGAQALGRDIKAIGGPGMKHEINEFFVRECNQAGSLKFILQMRSGFLLEEGEVEKDLRMLCSVFIGFKEA